MHEDNIESPPLRMNRPLQNTSTTPITMPLAQLHKFHVMVGKLELVRQAVNDLATDRLAEGATAVQSHPEFDPFYAALDNVDRTLTGLIDGLYVLAEIKEPLPEQKEACDGILH